MINEDLAKTRLKQFRQYMREAHESYLSEELPLQRQMYLETLEKYYTKVYELESILGEFNYG